MVGRASQERDRDENSRDKSRKTNRSGPPPVDTTGSNLASGSGGVANGNKSGESKFDVVTRTLLAPFQHRKTDSSRILSDREWFFLLFRWFFSFSRPYFSIGVEGNYIVIFKAIVHCEDGQYGLL